MKNRLLQRIRHAPLVASVVVTGTLYELAKQRVFPEHRIFELNEHMAHPGVGLVSTFVTAACCEFVGASKRARNTIAIGATTVLATGIEFGIAGPNTKDIKDIYWTIPGVFAALYCFRGTESQEQASS